LVTQQLRKKDCTVIFGKRRSLAREGLPLAKDIPPNRYFFFIDFLAAAFFTGALVAVAAFFAGVFLTAAFEATFFDVPFAAVTFPVADFFSVVLAVAVTFLGFAPPNAVSQPEAYRELDPTRVIVMSFPFEV
jgi:hypothetical protein